MGHFNSKRLLTIFIDLMEELGGQVTMRQVKWYCRKHRIGAEGRCFKDNPTEWKEYIANYDFHYTMILHEGIFAWWMKSWKNNPGIQIVPKFKTRKQEIALLEFLADNCDYYEGNEEKVDKILDGIPFSLSPGLKREDIKVLEYMEF